MEFIKDIERDIAKGLALDLFEESSVWAKNSHDHILEEEEILEGFQKMFLKRLFDHLPLFRDILYLLDPVPIRFTTYFWRTMWHMLGTKIKFSATYHPQAYDQIVRASQNLKDLSRYRISQSFSNKDLLSYSTEFALHYSILGPQSHAHLICP